MKKPSHSLRKNGLAGVQLDLQGTNNGIWTVGKYLNVIRYGGMSERMVDSEVCVQAIKK